jgi:hypothetical protein
MPAKIDQINKVLDQVADDLFTNDIPDLDGLSGKLRRLQAQVEVLNSLSSAAKIIRDATSKKSLPNQLSTRVKHLIKFAFEKPTRDTDDRSSKMQKLDCNSLKLCGLAYKVKDIIEMPSQNFEILVGGCVAQFIRSHGLLPYLYHNDIDKAVNYPYEIEDEHLLREFLKSSYWFCRAHHNQSLTQLDHIEHRPLKRKRVDEGMGRALQVKYTVSNLILVESEVSVSVKRPVHLRPSDEDRGEYIVTLVMKRIADTDTEQK